MSKQSDVEPFYLKRGEELIDALFEKGYFRDDVSRDELRNLDDLVGYMYQSQCESAVKIDRITRDLKKPSAVQSDNQLHKEG